MTTLVIGADTVVALNDRILEKPSDKEHARSMLRELSGNVHYVYTGVTIIEKTKENTTESCSFISTTRVKFAVLSEEAIEAYVNTNEPMDKAGGYGIQGYGRGLVESVEGDFFNVVGFPCYDFAHHLSERLQDLFPTARKQGRFDGN